MSTADAIGDLRGRIREVSPTEALAEQGRGALLLDVREQHERDDGMPTGAIGLSRGFLELKIADTEANTERPILTLCGSGTRSLLAADTLQNLGYRNVASISGGFRRWQEDALPVTTQTPLDADAAERYARQLQLPNVGPEGQDKLARARVVMLGAGGLGAPAALYLAAAGVGTLTLIDPDHVERSNLHRQVLHADARIGMPKTTSAKMSLQALNPRIDVRLHAQKLTGDNVEELLADHDVIFDGADNFPARYLLSAASLRLGIPMVYGAVERFAGQVSVFDPRTSESPCYRCLFPQPPAAADAPSCSEAGVLGVLPGMVGTLQACETLKLLLGIGQPLTGRVLNVDALSMSMRETRLRRDPACPGCSPEVAVPAYRDIEQMAGA